MCWWSRRLEQSDHRRRTVHFIKAILRGRARCILSAMVGWMRRLGSIFIPFLCGLFVLGGCTSATAEPTLPANTPVAPTSMATPFPSATPTPALVATLEAIIRAYTATPTPTHVPTPVP